MPVDPASMPFEVWPENEAAVSMWLRMSTQWRVGVNGVFGLDYSVLFELMNLYGIVDRKELVESIRVMESAAVPIMNKRA